MWSLSQWVNGMENSKGVHNVAITPKAQQWKCLNVTVFFYFWMLQYCKHSLWERNSKAIDRDVFFQGINDYHMYSLDVDAFHFV